jgi:hypothetical protein
MSAAPTQAPFRDVEKAAEGGLIIAKDILCSICGEPAGVENPHRVCLDKKVVETFQGAMASNEAVVASNKELGVALAKLSDNLMKLIASPPPGSFTVTFPSPTTTVSTVNPPDDPVGPANSKNEYMQRRKRAGQR